MNDSIGLSRITHKNVKYLYKINLVWLGLVFGNISVYIWFTQYIYDILIGDDGSDLLRVICAILSFSGVVLVPMSLNSFLIGCVIKYFILILAECHDSLADALDSFYEK